jgi:hypothetical protein
MAYGRNNWGNRGGGGNKPKGNSAKLTGLFRSANRELLTGSINGEQLDALIEKIKGAKASGNGLVVFCWKNTKGDGNPKAPIFNLSADVSKPRENKRPASRRIEEPADELYMSEGPADDDPFA